MPRLALAALGLCTLLPSLATSLTTVGLPAIAEAFAAPFERAQWVVLAYLLATTALVVGVGRLGDRWGRRRVLTLGLVAFATASAAGAMAPSLGHLVAARALQGVGGAALVALALSFVGDAVPPAQRGRALGVLGTVSAVGTALGPAAGGLLVERFGWAALFALQVPLAGAALVLVRRALPPARPAPAMGPPGRFDLAGTAWLAVALAAGGVAVTSVPGHGMRVPLACGLVAAAALAGFVRQQARADAPLVPRAAWRSPGLKATLAGAVLVNTVTMATLVVGPFHLGRGLGLSLGQAGLVMTLGPVVAALAGVPAGRLVDRWGAPGAVRRALAAMAAASGLLGVGTFAGHAAGYAVPLMALTAAYALFLAASQAVVLASVPPAQRGVVSGLATLARHLGFLVGVGAMGAVFAAGAGGDVLAASPSAVVAGTRWTFTVAAGLLLLAWATVRPRRLPA